MRLLGTTALFGPAIASAQPGPVRSIGWLSLRSPDTQTEKSVVAAFRQGLSQTGFVEGKNLAIEFRFGEGNYDRLPALAADLVKRQVALIVTSGGTQLARIAQAATTTIPIVFAAAGDPVQEGVVKSFNRPGGNTTGTYLMNNGLGPKRLEVIRELVPNVRAIGFLVNSNGPTTEGQIRLMRTAAEAVATQVQVLEASNAAEIDAAFAALAARRVDALVMGADPLFQVHLDQVIALAARYRIPTIYEWPEFVKAGGLVAYATDRIEMLRQLGVYAGRILNGAKPAELPIMQPTKFDLAVNLKTANALGLKIPESFLRLADEVIE